MVGGDQKRFAGVAIALIVTSLLAGCASSSASSNELTLAKTKSPVQLLRNEAASRVPSGIVGEVLGNEDISISCKTEAVDPKGLVRRWKSSVLMGIEKGSSWRVTNVTDDIVDSFTEEGWTASRGPATTVTVTILESELSSAAIEIASTLPKEDKSGATIRITTTGPCVATEGADSSEVRKLENRDD
jgi:hypothetical protein